MTETDQKVHDEPECTPVFQCLGCGVTYDEIQRLHIPRKFNHTVPRSDRLLPICSECEHDHGVLARAIVDEMRRMPQNTYSIATIETQRARVEALWALRDKLVADECIDAFAARYSQTNEVLNRHHGAISEVRKLLGLDGATEKKEPDGKLAAIGAIGGALMGAGLMMSKRPLETLRFMMDRAQEMLRSLGIDSPEDASL